MRNGSANPGPEDVSKMLTLVYTSPFCEFDSRGHRKRAQMPIATSVALRGAWIAL